MSGAALAILMMVFVLFFNYARNNADKNLSGEIPEDLDLNFSELPETDIPLIDDDATRSPFVSSALDALRKLLQRYRK